MSPTTVGEYLSRAESARLGWPLPQMIGDARLETRSRAVRRWFGISSVLLISLPSHTLRCQYHLIPAAVRVCRHRRGGLLRLIFALGQGLVGWHCSVGTIVPGRAADQRAGKE